MKKILFVLIFMLFITPVVSYAETAEYSEGQYGLDISIDSKWSPSDENIIEYDHESLNSEFIKTTFGLDYETARMLIDDKGLFLIGKYNDIYLLILITDASEYAINTFDNYDDDELMEMFYLEDEEGVIDQDLYDARDVGGQRYIRISSYVAESEEYVLDYMTVVNSKLYTFKFEKFGEEFSLNDEMQANTIVRAATYNVDPELTKEPRGSITGDAWWYDALIAGVLGVLIMVPGIIIHNTKRKKARAKRGDKALELDDSNWADDTGFGYSKEKAIVVKNIEEYLSQLQTRDGADIEWKKSKTGAMSDDKNYEYELVDLEIYQIYRKGTKNKIAELFFYEGGKKNSENLPLYFKRKDPGKKVEEDKIVKVDKTSELVLDEDGAKLNEKEEFSKLPYEELKELKALYEKDMITEEEYDAKRKQLLGL